MNIPLYILIVIGAILVGFMLRDWLKDFPIIGKYDGLFLVDDSDDKTVQWILDVKIDPMTIPSKKSIHLKVKMMDQNTNE